MKKRIISAVAFALLICLFAVGASASQIKNVIFLIPDGAGYPTYDFANDVKVAGGFDSTKFPYKTPTDTTPMYMRGYLAGSATTLNYLGQLTDSAAAGTALATGHKTMNSYLGLDFRGRPKANIAEAAQSVGKATGVVATYEWMHATPASFGAHVLNRTDYENIYEQMENQGFDVVLGSGYGAVSSYASIQNAVDRGYTVITNRTDLENVKAGDRIWGNATNNSSPYDINLTSEQPTLAQMTQAAITALSGDEDGFFLMVEGSKVDTGAHANDAVVSSSEYIAFDAAVRVAIEFAKGRTDTVVVVTPDHDTGGMYYDQISDLAAAVASVQAGTDPDSVTWETGSHTTHNVGVWMYVPEGVDTITGLNSTVGDTPETRANYVIDNTAFAPYMASLMGVDLAELTKELFVDVTEIGSYSEATGKFTFNNTTNGIKYIIKNQSTYYLGGEAKSAGGQIAVYANGRMYVPASIVSEDDWNYVSDGTEGIQGSGTKADPYVIDTESDFIEFTAAVVGGETYSGVYFVQDEDLDLSSASDYIAMTGSNTFSGVYDGKGYKINVNVTKDGEAAVFGTIGSGGMVMNVGVTGSLTSNTTYAAGIVRKIAAGGKLINSYSTATLSGTGASGITMSVYGTIENCFFGGTITSGANYAIGNIATDSSGNAGTAANCYYVDTCGASQTADGVTGVTEEVAKSTLAASLESGKAAAATTAGVTEDELSLWRQSSTNGYPELYVPVPTVTSVTVSPSTATVNKGDALQLTATVVGEFNPSTEVIWSIEATETLAKGTKLYEDGYLYISPLESASGFTVMAKSAVNGAVVGTSRITVGSTTVTGEDGTRARPYLIENEEDYLEFVNAIIGGNTYSGKYFKQTANLDMAGVSGYNGIPDSVTFSGTYDGAGHTINVDIASSASANNVFGVIQNATIMNLGVTGSVSNEGQYSAGIVRKMYTSTVINCYVSADITSTGKQAGGIAISNYGDYIANCYVSGSVLGSTIHTIANLPADTAVNYNNFFLGEMYIKSTDATEISPEMHESEEFIAILNEGREASAKETGIAVSRLCEWTLGASGPMFVREVDISSGVITEDTVIANLSLTSDMSLTSGEYVATINNLSVSEGVTLTLGEGTYIIENFSGEGSVVASPLANVIVTGDNKPSGYVQIELGQRADEANVRYAEIGGKQVPIRENNDLYGLIATADTLVEITEKTSDEAVVATKTSYYAVDASEQTYTELSVLENGFVNANDLSVRADSPVGVRFKTLVADTARGEKESFEIIEYGFIIGVESSLINNGEELNFNASKYVTGVAYSTADNIDKIFDSTNDAFAVVTGVLYNIPESAYGENIVSKTYARISVNGTEFTVYGEPIVTSIYEVALISQALDMSDEQKAVITNIIDTAQDMSPDLGFDVGGLYN